MSELEDLSRKITDDLLNEGVQVFWQHEVESVNHRGQPWAYTVGRTMHGRPELLVTGLTETVSRDILAELMDRDVHPDFPVATSVGTVSFILAETGLLHAAYAVFGLNFSALQVLWHGEGEQPLHPAGGLILTDPYGDGLPEVP